MQHTRMRTVGGAVGRLAGGGYAYMRDVLDANQGHHGTLAAAAAALRVDADALEAEVAAFRSAMRAETEDPYGQTGRPPDGGPYLVIDPRTFPRFRRLRGGQLDLQMRALRLDCTPIPGLYVAGNTAAGAMLDTPWAATATVSPGHS